MPPMMMPYGYPPYGYAPYYYPQHAGPNPGHYPPYPFQPATPYSVYPYHEGAFPINPDDSILIQKDFLGTSAGFEHISRLATNPVSASKQNT
jgi:hypothetical protein